MGDVTTATHRLPSAGFSITIRVSVHADASAIGRLTTAVGEAGGVVTAVDVVDSDSTAVVVDLTCDTADSAHAEQVCHRRPEPAREQERGDQRQHDDRGRRQHPPHRKTSHLPTRR